MRDEFEIKCHGPSPSVFKFGTPHWREAEPPVRDDGYSGNQFRTCSYCGSIHPKDLMRALAAGGTMHGSDWKYGWPHKFYARIPNPTPGVPCKTGMSYQGDKVTEIMGTTPESMHGKFYSTHLTDLTDEEFQELSALLLQHTDIEFLRHQEKGLGWRAPSLGYQR